MKWFIYLFHVGVSIPIFNVLFGKMLDNLNDPGASFQGTINDLCLIFVYIGLGNILSGYLVSNANNTHRLNFYFNAFHYMILASGLLDYGR